MSLENSELSVVLNKDSGFFVTLPLNNEQVIKQGCAVYDSDYDLITIDGDSYEKLKLALNLADPDNKVIRDFYISFCGNIAGYGVPVMSDRAYGAIYDSFMEDGLTMKQVLDGMPDNMWHWKEDSVYQYLDCGNVDFGQRTDDELAQLAIDTIHKSDNHTLHSTYKADHEDVVLYTVNGE